MEDTRGVMVASDDGDERIAIHVFEPEHADAAVVSWNEGGTAGEYVNVTATIEKRG